MTTTIQWKQFSFFTLNHKFTLPPELASITQVVSLNSDTALLFSEPNTITYILSNNENTRQITDAVITPVNELKAYKTNGGFLGINENIIYFYNIKELLKEGGRVLYQTKSKEIKIERVFVFEELIFIGLNNFNFICLKNFKICCSFNCSGTINAAVTGIGLVKETDCVLFFIACDNSVCCYKTASITAATTCKLLYKDNISDEAKITCTAVAKDENSFLVATNEAVYFYTAEGRMNCVIINQIKTNLFCLKNYLCISSGGGDSVKEFSIYDYKNKVVVYLTKADNKDEVLLLDCSESLNILKGRDLFQLTEIDFAAKIKLLCNKNLYPIAINYSLANSTPQETAEIYKDFGNHLYDKGDFYAAMQQYINTIPFVEASFVVLKYLRHLELLCTYLEAVLDNNDSFDRSYGKIDQKDLVSLLGRCYVKCKEINKLRGLVLKYKLEFNFEEIKQVLSALDGELLSGKNGGTDDLNAVQFKEFLLKEYNNVELLLHFQEYEKSLNLLETDSVDGILRYSKVLLKHLPKQTCDLLVKKCAHCVELVLPLFNTLTVSDEYLEYFLTRLLEVNKCREEGMIGFNGNDNKQDLRMNIVPIVNTLFELYLKQCKYEEAMAILRNDEYDIDHLVVLCDINGFIDGKMFLLEKLKKFDELLEHYVTTKKYDKLIMACREYDLWSDLINYEIDDEKVLTEMIRQLLESGYSLVELLEKLVKRNISLKIFKPFIVDHINSATRDRKLLEYEETNTDLITFEDSKCTSCGLQVDLPAVFFYCGHCFHVKCLGLNEKVCRVCSVESKHVFELEERKVFLKENHEAFFRGANFDQICDYLGLGIL